LLNKQVLLLDHELRGMFLPLTVRPQDHDGINAPFMYAGGLYVEFPRLTPARGPSAALRSC
jgi:hypothetical protein